MTAPEGSVTVPVTVPLPIDCENIGLLASNASPTRLRKYIYTATYRSFSRMSSNRSANKTAERRRSTSDFGLPQNELSEFRETGKEVRGNGWVRPGHRAGAVIVRTTAATRSAPAQEPEELLRARPTASDPRGRCRSSVPARRGARARASAKPLEKKPCRRRSAIRARVSLRMCAP
jgi:hypothetical protein